MSRKHFILIAQAIRNNIPDRELRQIQHKARLDEVLPQIPEDPTAPVQLAGRTLWDQVFGN